MFKSILRSAFHSIQLNPAWYLRLLIHWVMLSLVQTRQIALKFISQVLTKDSPNITVLDNQSFQSLNAEQFNVFQAVLFPMQLLDLLNYAKTLKFTAPLTLESHHRHKVQIHYCPAPCTMLCWGRGGSVVHALGKWSIGSMFNPWYC